MAAPTIDITSYTRSRISAIAGIDFSDVAFTTDQTLVNWEARAGGAGLGQGLLVGAPEVRETWSQIDALGLTWNSFDARGYSFDTINVVLPFWSTWGQVDGLGLTWNGFGAAGYTYDTLSTALATPPTGSFRVDNEELTQGDIAYRINVYGKNQSGEWTPYAG